MAKRKRGKRARLKTVLLFVLAPIIIWILAFITWLYSNDILRNFTPGNPESSRPAKAPPNHETKQVPAANEKRPREEIRDEERNKLDEIIRRETR